MTATVYIDKAKIDDPVGAILVHGVVGIWGLHAVAFTNPEGSLIAQLTGIVVIFAWVFSTSLVNWPIIKAVTGIRVSEGVWPAEVAYRSLPGSRLPGLIHPENEDRAGH